MSQFDRHITYQYIDAMRLFLKVGKPNVFKMFGFYSEENTNIYTIRNADALKRMESAVNQRSALVEDPNSTIPQRIALARDYKGLTSAEVGKQMGVTRSAANSWSLREGKYPLSDKRLSALATIFDVPFDWLRDGDISCLAANSHLGVQIGDRGREIKKQLKLLTKTMLRREVFYSAQESFIQAYIEHAVFHRPQLATLARQAGGRWQMHNGELVFCAWIPVQDRYIKKIWCNKVEKIIQYAIDSEPTLYKAWFTMRKLCEEKGYEPHEYPKKDALYKRIQRERSDLERFGVSAGSTLHKNIKRSVKRHRLHEIYDNTAFTLPASSLIVPTPAPSPDSLYPLAI